MKRDKHKKKQRDKSEGTKVRCYGAVYTVHCQYERATGYVRITEITSASGIVPLPTDHRTYLSERDAIIAAEKHLAARALGNQHSY